MESGRAVKAGRRVTLVSIVLVAFCILLAGRSVAVPVQHTLAAGATVHYGVGWNLVAGPTGTDLSGSIAPYFAYGPASTSYQSVASTEILGGRAVWAYFPAPTDVTLGLTAADYTRMLLPANQFALIGNPSATDTLQINGADLALAYDTVAGSYVPITALKPGQGAWVISAGGADVTVGKAPTGQSAETVRRLQVGLTTDAVDVSTFGKVPAVAQELLAARQYSQVQAAMDDLKSAFADGLLLEHAAPIPSLTRSEHDDAVAVREAVSRAATASASGDLKTADASIEAGRKAATASVNDASALARTQAEAQSGGQASLFDYAAWNVAGQQTPASKAIYGALCLATVPALALNAPPPDSFGGLVVAVLNNNPLPPVTSPTATAAPTTTAAPVAAAATAPVAGPAPTGPVTACTCATLTLTPTASSGSAAVTLAATGLDANAPYSVFFNLTRVVSGSGGLTLGPAPPTTDASGNLSLTLTVAVLPPPGNTPVQIATAGRCAQVFFTVLPPPTGGTMPRSY